MVTFKKLPTIVSASGDRMRKGWGPSGLLREAVKNGLFGSRLTLVLILTVSIALACAVLQRAEAAAFLQAQKDRASSGWNVLTISSLDATTPTEVDRASCERMVLDPRVAAAGVVSLDEIEYSKQLARKLQVARVSASLIPQAYQHDGAVGSALLASPLPVRLLVDDEPLLLTPLPLLPRGVDFNSLVVLPLDGATRWYDSCIVVGATGAPMNDVSDVAVASVVTKGGEPVARLSVTPWVDNVAAHLARYSALAPFAAGVLLGLLLSLSMRWRASEIGVYRLAGASRRATLALLVLEASLVSTSFMVVGLLASMVLAPSFLAGATNVTRFIGASALILAISFVGASFMARSDPTRLLGDR